MFGYGQFSRTGRYKLSDNEKFLGGNFGPFIPSISGTGAGTTSATPGNGYTYQTFTSSGTLYVDQPITADILIIGGGGSGGGGPVAPGGGGGGSGGVVEITNYSLSAGSYTVVVGSGATNYDSYRGGSSYILTGAGTTLALALGGGVGGSGYYYSTPTAPISGYIYNAAPGGSGGGAVGYSPPVPTTYSNAGAPAAQPAYPQPLIPAPNLAQHGFAGGNSSPHGGYGGGSAQGGGGGAGAVGGSAFGVGPNPGNIYGGSGGAGKQFLDFKGPDIGVPALGPYNGVYAGGGGAWSTYITPSNPYRPLGGNGGGGNGGYLFQPPYPANPTTEQNGTNGVANTGGGGGGGSTLAGPKSGGSGLIVVRYQVSP